MGERHNVEDDWKKVVENLDFYLWDITNNVICSICQEPFTEPVTTSCGHSFCSKCLKRFLCGTDNLNRVCPLCRHPLKRREAMSNPLLSAVSKICHKFPEAFKEDVLRLSPEARQVTEELVKGSRVLDMSEHEKSRRNCNESLDGTLKRKSRKTKGTAKEDLKESVEGDDVGNEDQKVKKLRSNGEAENFPSEDPPILQSDSAACDTPRMGRKLKKNRNVPAEKRITDWLRDAGSESASRPRGSSLKCGTSKSLDGREISDNEPKSGTTSSADHSIPSKKTYETMIRFDYTGKKKSGSRQEEVGPSAEDGSEVKRDEADPYEFIASQKSINAKDFKKKVTRGRKKNVPMFQSIQTFTKDDAKKYACGEDEVAEEGIENSNDGKLEISQLDKNDLKVLPGRRTYRRIPKINTSSEMNRESVIPSPVKILSSDNESSPTAKKTVADGSSSNPLPGRCATATRSSRRKLSVSSDDDTADARKSSPLPGKKARKLVGDVPAEETNARDTDLQVSVPDDKDAEESREDAGVDGKDCKLKLVRDLKADGKGVRSPGWSRVNKLKKDFETADRRSRSTRRTLNISGGELTSSSSKMKSSLNISPEEMLTVDEANQEYVIHDVSQSTKAPSEFDSAANTTEEKGFRGMVEDVERELAETSAAVERNTGNGNGRGMDATLGVKHDAATGDRPLSNEVEDCGESPGSDDGIIATEHEDGSNMCEAGERTAVASERIRADNIVIRRAEARKRKRQNKGNPLALLGRICKKKRVSIAILHFGKMGPNLRKCQSAALKLVSANQLFRNPRKRAKSEKKLVTVGVQTSPPECGPSPLLNASVARELADGTIPGRNVQPRKVDVEIQTSEKFMEKSQTQSPQRLRCATHDGIAVAADATGAGSQGETRKMNTCGKSEKASKNRPSHTDVTDKLTTENADVDSGARKAAAGGDTAKESLEADLDSEIQCGLNMTWTQVDRIASVPPQRSPSGPVVSEKSRHGTNSDKCQGAEMKAVESKTPVSRRAKGIDVAKSSRSGCKDYTRRALQNVTSELAKGNAAAGQSPRTPSSGRQRRNVDDDDDDSDSDSYIEQTPPRAREKNSSVIEESPLAAGRRDKPLSHLARVRQASKVVEDAEESFLLLSECQNILAIPNTEVVAANPGDEGTKPVAEVSSNAGQGAGIAGTSAGKPPETAEDVENDENDRNQLNSPREAPNRVCIVSSGVRDPELIERFAKRFDNVTLSPKPVTDMTHLIVGLHENDCDELVPYCTPKLLYAMAHRKWVVNESWIENCLKKGTIVAEDPFESVDPVGGLGCRAARKSDGRLLEGFEFLLWGYFDAISKEEFTVLIRALGGSVAQKQEEFFSPKSTKTRMILLDHADVLLKSTIENMAKRCRAAVFSRDFIIMSIQSYKLCNITDFLRHSMTEEALLEWGYPPSLLENEDDRESESGSSDDSDK